MTETNAKMHPLKRLLTEDDFLWLSPFVLATALAFLSVGSPWP